MPSAANGLILAGRHTRVTCAVASGHRGPGLSIIWLKGEHDAATVGDLRTLLSVEVASTTNDLIVDLTDVTFMGSSTLMVLVSANAALGQQGRNLSARGTPPCVRRLFELANLAPLPAPAPRREARFGNIRCHDHQTGPRSDPISTHVFATV